MKVYEGIASALVEEGDGTIFGLMGDGNISLWGALASQGEMKIISARHEAAAVSMADGYFRATGKLGIATITCGPGLTQVGTSLVAAARNRAAIVVVIGEIPPGEKNKLQTMDQRRFAEACESLYFSITSTDTAAEEVAEAFFAARTHCCPVILNLPIDLQEKVLEWEWSYRPSVDFVPRQEVAANPAALDELVDALSKAQRPVIIAGRGARRAAAREEIRALATQVGAILGTSLQAKGLFDGDEFDVGIAGAYASEIGEELFAQADFVLGIGAELGYYTAEGGLLFPMAEVARIDTAPAPRELGTIPGLYIQGDAKKTALAVTLRLQERQERLTGYRTDETRQRLTSEPHPIEKTTDGLDPRILMQELARALEPGSIVTCGAGHFLGIAAMHLPLPHTADMQFSVQFGAIGQTIGVAIGIALANPGKPHIVIEGDGSLMMHIQELDTVVRHKIPMVLLVWNDGGFGAEVHKLKIKGYDPALAQYPTPDFPALARSMGGDGLALKSEDELPGAIAAGMEKGGLYVIEMNVSPTLVSDAYKKIHLGIPNRSPLLRHAGVYSDAV